MMRARTIPWLVLAVLGSACVDNTHLGNDREASLDPAAPPAEVASAGEATSGVSTHLIQAEPMTEADLRNAPDVGEACVFRYTRVGFPIFRYGPRAGVVKLNGKLVPLPAAGTGTYMDGPVRITIRPLEEDDGEGQFPAEFVLRLEGAPNELGFYGFSDC